MLCIASLATPGAARTASFADMNLQSTIKVACSNCNLRELCMPVGLNEQQL